MTSLQIAKVRLLRLILAGLSVLCFALGWVALWVPGLPTTIFWIASAYLATKSCPVIQRWIYQRGGIGRSVEMIVEHRALTASGKRRAIAGMLFGVALSLTVLFVFGSPALWLIAVIVGGVLLGAICVVFGLRTCTDDVLS